MQKNVSNISRIFFEAADKWPGNKAIIEKQESVTYNELREEVLKTARYFHSRGITSGDRVLVFVPMSIDLYRIVLALFHIGAVAVFLDEWVSKKRMEECCKVAQCKGFIGITKARLLRWFSPELRKIPVVLSIKNSGKELHLNGANVSEKDTALITFTTGSTGVPKAAKRTHGFLREQFNVLRNKIDPQPGDIDICMLPIVLLINLGAGASSVIADFKASKPEKFKADLLYRIALGEKVTRITGSPFFLLKLSDHLIRNSLSLPEIKKVFTGGAPVFPSEAALFLKAFPDCDVQIVYGSTEAEPISSISAFDLDKRNEGIAKGLAVGIPHPLCEVKIISITDEVIEAQSEHDLKVCPTGEPGEIIVSGPHVLREYFNNPAAYKRNKIVIGEKIYHRTGDSGFLSERGELFLTGRCNAIIRDGEAVIYPFLFEGFLKQFSEIRMGTLIQVKGKIFAVIEAPEKINREKIKSFSSLINEIVILDNIPRDPRHNSKIDYERLKQRLLKDGR